MAKEKVSFADLDEAALSAEVRRMEGEYNQAKYDHAARGLSNPMELREMRRNIARAYTLDRGREVAAFTPEQLANRSKIRARRAKR